METSLRQMNEQEFDRFLAFLIPDYAKDLSSNFLIPLETAMEESAQLMGDLLPAKQHSKNQFVLNIYSTEENKNIGVIWYNIQAESSKAYIYYISVYEEFRNKGYAGQALLNFEEDMKKTGISSLGLNVFGTNPHAHRLYAKLGYQVASTAMGKRI